MYYRFNDGTFIKATTFEAAKAKKIERLQEETERKTGWHKCCCVGFDHRYDCPEKSTDIPY